MRLPLCLEEHRANADAAEKRAAPPGPADEMQQNQNIQLVRRYKGSDSLQAQKVDSLEVILKVAERCNINCTYCYFFDTRNSDYQDKPALLKEQTIDALADYLTQAIEEFGIREVTLILHGGEPLMMQKPKFRAMCQVLQDKLGERTCLKWSLQTNAMLLDDEWVDLFNEFNIRVGVSVDGAREVHDRHRIDHRGQGTYDRTRQGIELLKRRSDSGFGVISVIGPDNPAAQAYRHFVHELGANRVHFTILDETHDTATPPYLAGVANNLLDLYREWRGADGTGVPIRSFIGLLESMLNGNEALTAFERTVGNHKTITVRSDGSIGPDDTFRNSRPDLFELGLSVSNSRLSDLLNEPQVAALLQQISKIPKACGDCCWQRVCRGGTFVTGPLHRYSAVHAFDNANVHCQALQALLTEMCGDALNSGASLDAIQEVLFTDN